MSPEPNESDALLVRELIGEARAAEEAEEAEGSGPKFSQELHERIMSRIAHSPASGRHSPPRSRLLLPSGLAAAAILMIGLLIWMNHIKASHPAPSRIVATGEMPSVPTIQNPIRVFDLPAICQVSPADYVDLDQGSQKLLGYLTRQLDVFPAPKRTSGPAQNEVQ